MSLSYCCNEIKHFPQHVSLLIIRIKLTRNSRDVVQSIALGEAVVGLFA